jgi:hypothetical protein
MESVGSDVNKRLEESELSATRTSTRVRKEGLRSI